MKSEHGVMNNLEEDLLRASAPLRERRIESFRNTPWLVHFPKKCSRFFLTEPTEFTEESNRFFNHL
jgi:hypothetical protein